MNIQQAFQLAFEHHQSGRLAEAEAIYRQILAVEPRHADALHNLGGIAHRAGRHAVAIDLILRAIALAPGTAHFYSNLGEVYRVAGRLDDALAVYRQAIALKPDFPDAHSNLGNALWEKGQLDEAIAACRQAIALNPNLVEAHSNLGNALGDKGQLDEAIAACRQAIALNPAYSEAYSNLSSVLRDKGQLDEAIDACRQAMALQPDLPEAHSNLGVALLGKGQLDGAIAAFRQGIACKPNYAEAHNNLALALLLQGSFLEGWQEHEWRWKAKDFSSPWRNFAQPQWDGSPLEGRSILLHAEQGCGDVLQFIRYLPLVERRGGQVVIECQPQLQRLLGMMAPGLPIVARGQALPAFELHCPLLSLPRAFATDLSNIPRDIPYLRADAADEGRWRERLEEHSASLKVGLVWAGNPAHKNDRNRSLGFASLAPLAEVPGVQFYSLQKGEAAREAVTPPEGMDWRDFTEELRDFADTAALIANLDLVVAVDTAVVHLAGAMGKPVWTLLPFAPDWRWLLGRSDSPWYPTMRLFRQPSIGDWDSVIAEVRECLCVLVGSNRGRP